MDVETTKDYIFTVNKAFEAFQAQYDNLLGKLTELDTRFHNIKNDRDRLKAKLGLLNLPDRPCGICRNQIYGQCRKQTCEWEDLS
jgi:hypothetical protein